MGITGCRAAVAGCRAWITGCPSSCRQRLPGTGHWYPSCNQWLPSCDRSCHREGCFQGFSSEIKSLPATLNSSVNQISHLDHLKAESALTWLKHASAACKSGHVIHYSDFGNSNRLEFRPDITSTKNRPTKIIGSIALTRSSINH